MARLPKSGMMVFGAIVKKPHISDPGKRNYSRSANFGSTTIPLKLIIKTTKAIARNRAFTAPLPHPPLVLVQISKKVGARTRAP